MAFFFIALATFNPAFLTAETAEFAELIAVQERKRDCQALSPPRTAAKLSQNASISGRWGHITDLATERYTLSICSAVSALQRRIILFF